MGRAILFTLLSLLLFVRSLTAQLPAVDSISLDVKHIAPIKPFRQYPEAYQRLLLQLAYTYYTVVRENTVDLDSSLAYASGSLGLPRMLVIDEAFPEPLTVNGPEWFDARDPRTPILQLSSLSGKQRKMALLQLGAYYAFQSNGHRGYRDSAIYLLTSVEKEAGQVDDPQWGRQAHCLMLKIFAEDGDLEKADSISKAIIRDCERAGDWKTAAKCWMWRGLYTAFTPQIIAKRIDWLNKADSLYKHIGNPAGRVNALTDIGYLYIASGRVKEAQAVFRLTVELEDSMHFPFNYYSTTGLSLAGIHAGKYGEPLRWALSAARTAFAAKDSIGWPYFFAEVGILYGLDQMYSKEALVWLNQAIDRLQKTDRAGMLYKAVEAECSILLGEHQAREALGVVKRIYVKSPPQGPQDQRDYHMLLMEAYGQLGYRASGETEVKQLLRWQDSTEKLRGSFDRALTSERIGIFFYDLGESKKAREYLDQETSDPSYSSVVASVKAATNWTLYHLDSMEHDYVAAIQHLLLAKQFDEMVSEQHAHREQEELNVQYETGRQEQEIVNRDRQINVLQQQDQLRQANLRQANLTRNITIGAIILILLAALLLYRQYRQKQKAALLIEEKNKLLEHLVKEKEWLLKEIHHRVKNNLHTVICLLESQAHYLENDALRAIEVSQHRIYAMSLLHQKIYQSADVKTIDMASYVPEFIGYLWESFGSPGNIKFDLSVGPLKLDIAQAIPIALIVNEGVTNSIKYAFPQNHRGVISVSLAQVGDEIRLIVADNGIGMGPVDKEAEAGSLGIELIKGLTGEMHGNIVFDSHSGTSIQVTVSAGPLEGKDEISIQRKLAAV